MPGIIPLTLATLSGPEYIPWNYPDGSLLHVPSALISAHQRLPKVMETHVSFFFSRHWSTLGPTTGQDRWAELMPLEPCSDIDSGVLWINSHFLATQLESPPVMVHTVTQEVLRELQSPKMASGLILFPSPPVSELLPISVSWDLLPLR